MASTTGGCRNGLGCMVRVIIAQSCIKTIDTFIVSLPHKSVKPPHFVRGLRHTVAPQGRLCGRGRLGAKRLHAPFSAFGPGPENKADIPFIPRQTQQKRP